MDPQSEWDHNRWARIYEKFERAYLELPRRLFIEIAQLQASRPIRRVLDIGCGDGKGLVYLRGRLVNTELVGIDPDPNMVRVARSRLRGRVQAIVASAEDFPESLGRFDLVLSYMNVHLWGELVRGLRHVQAALTDEGMAYLVDIRRDIPVRVREEGLKHLPQGNFRAVSEAQIESGLSLDDVRSRMDEAGITTYRLLDRMPSGFRRGIGITAGRTGRRSEPIAEITRQMAEAGLAGSPRSASSLLMHLFIYPQPTPAARSTDTCRC
jgi:SAM-dependent methyltransferase